MATPFVTRKRARPSTTSDVDVLSSKKASPFPREELSSEVSSVASVGIDFEETLTCTICQSTYTDPHILSCLHSFCKSCLSKRISATKVRGPNGSNTIKCPLCRSEHSLSAKGVDVTTGKWTGFLALRSGSTITNEVLPRCGYC